MDTPFPNPEQPPPPAARPRPPLALTILFILFVVLFSMGTVAFFITRVFIHRALQTSLPTIDGSLHVAGLAAPVTVLRDAHGVPHIRAVSLDDLAFAQGYVTAQDRLWQMDLLRRHAAGDLAEIIGPKMLQHDEHQRLLLLRSTADNIIAQMPATELRYLNDYAAGVNALIADSAGHLPAEFRFMRYAPAPWQPRDSVLVGLVMVQDLTTGFPIKLAHEQIAAKLPTDLLSDLYPVGSWRDHPPTQPPVDLTAPQPTIPDVPLDESQSELRKPAAIPQHTDDVLALLHALTPCANCRVGSNEWVLSGAHTASGRPLLSNDMHLSLSVPELWYMADLSAPTLHVAGVTLPGMPFVIAGHNDRIAWGYTNLGADVQDIYIEHLRGSNYLAPDGSWQALQHHPEVIHVRGHRDVTLDVLATAHGPIITPMLPHESRNLSLQWIIYKSGAVDLDFLALNSSTDWPSFTTALSNLGAPSLNVVYADVDGHIGYHAIGRIPIRGSMAHPSGLSPIPVDSTQDASYEWTGYIPFDQLPQSFDPPGGLLATANSRITPDGYPYSVTLNWEAPFRNERIWKVLADAHNLKPSDMLALQLDTHSAVDTEIAQRLAYAIDHTADVPPQIRQAADILRSWDGNVDKHSAAANIVSTTLEVLWPILLQPHLGKPKGDEWQLYTWGEMSYVEEELVEHQPARWLPAQYRSWNDLLTSAVATGLHAGHAPLILANWPYGATHRLDLEHPIFGTSPALRAAVDLPVGTGSVPLSGDGSTVRQSKGVLGPSERFTADLSNLDNSTLNIVMGESGNLLSPWFHDQWDAWYTGSTFPMPFSALAVDKAATHTLTLLPR